MATQQFTPEEWKTIRDTLDKDPVKFGLPRRVYGSAFSSMNHYSQNTAEVTIACIVTLLNKLTFCYLRDKKVPLYSLP